jgi:IS4 transposase
VAAQLGPVIEAMGGQLPSLLPGHRVRIIDGNQLTATDRRLAVLRDTKAGARPGQSLVVLDPALMLAVDMIPCEDAYAQERSLLSQVLSRVAPGEVWVGDRNFCTVMFLQGILERKGHFVIRQHGRFPVASYGTLRSRGRCNSGQVFEQTATFPGADGAPIEVRRVVVRLDAPTQDGDTEIAILTDLSARKASAAKIANMYRERWTVEGLFLTLTQTLSGEVPSLGYPKAALFAFGVALVSYNVSSVVRAALRTKFGHETVEQRVSSYYIANEVRVVAGGMDVALEDAVWEPFQHMPAAELAKVLVGYAGHVRLAKFKKHPRGPKKATPLRTNPTGKAHVSTARLLAQAGQRM